MLQHASFKALPEGAFQRNKSSQVKCDHTASCTNVRFPSSRVTSTCLRKLFKTFPRSLGTFLVLANNQHVSDGATLEQGEGALVRLLDTESMILIANTIFVF